MNRKKLEEIFLWIFENFPQLEGKIAWKQPMFLDHKTFIIDFSYSKNHIAIAIEKIALNKFSKNIENLGYKQSSSLFYIEWDQDVNFNFFKKIIKFNIKDKKLCQNFWRK